MPHGFVAVSADTEQAHPIDTLFPAQARPVVRDTVLYVQADVAGQDGGTRGEFDGCTANVVQQDVVRYMRHKDAHVR